MLREQVLTIPTSIHELVGIQSLLLINLDDGSWSGNPAKFFQLFKER